jgi:hypothetical protein
MIRLGTVLVVLVTLAVTVLGQTNTRVENNALISDRFPAIVIRIDKEFKYSGKFDFRIRDVALGERYVFVDAAGRKIKRLFIAQFEQILPKSDEIYRYNFDNALTFSGHKFRQNTYAFSNLSAAAENPAGEAALTQAFLKEKGLQLEDELMMSRFVNVPDAEKKHELILFYIENVRPTKKRVSDFYTGDGETEVWRRISQDLTKRSLTVFKIER